MTSATDTKNNSNVKADSFMADASYYPTCPVYRMLRDHARTAFAKVIPDAASAVKAWVKLL
jgi:hypothetical protein